MSRLDEKTIKDLSYFLTDNSRLKLLDKLAKLCRKRVHEKISLETGIAKSHVYRYLPKNPKSRRTVPNENTTAKIIKALIRNGSITTIISELDEAEAEIRRVIRNYTKWKKEKKKWGLIEDSLSSASIRRFERSV